MQKQKTTFMKKNMLIALFLLFSGTMAHAQKAGQTVFGEAGGPGLISFNYDTRFSARNDGWGMRVGLGGFYIDGDGFMLVPVTINQLLGSDGTNFFELGAGATFVPFSSERGIAPFGTTTGHLNFGYRYQPRKQGFVFRAVINPVFGRDFFWPVYGGISIGYKLQ